MKSPITHSPRFVGREDATVGQPVSPPENARIMFYSHDTMGLGHLRRNLLIAEVLSRGPVHADVLMVSGAREACHFAAMQGIDCVTLPALYKDTAGNYSSKHLRSSYHQTTALRSRIITATIDAFAPHLLVVDKIPRGVDCELDEALQLIRSRGKTRCVLGLREVLDDPASVAQEWISTNAESVIRDHYEEVWIYGDPRVYDSINQYSFSHSTSERSLYTGYLDQRQRNGQVKSIRDRSLSQNREVVCVVGGGQDGARLADAFITTRFAQGMNGVLITGPFMPTADRNRLRKFADAHANVVLIEDVVEADHYIARAERVVSMAGYNTISAILSFGKPALVVPRTTPRREQWIRAKLLDERGALTMLDPKDLHPNVIQDWLMRLNVAAPGNASIDIGGLNRIVDRVTRLLPAGSFSSGVTTEPSIA